jgi:hypothetical protein
MLAQPRRISREGSVATLAAYKASLAFRDPLARPTPDPGWQREHTRSVCVVAIEVL